MLTEKQKICYIHITGVRLPKKHKEVFKLKKRFWSFVMALALTVSAAAAPSFCGGVEAYAAANYGSTEIESYARQVAAIVNSERAANGLSPLKYSDQLSEAALVRAKEIQSTFSHTRPNGSSCFTAIKEAGISYTTAGENIAYGQKTPEEVMNSWMNSSGHRANILGQNYEYIGIGVTYQNGTYYWTQFFAASNDLTGEIITSNATTATTKTTAAPTTKATTAATTAATTQATTAATTQATTAVTTGETTSTEAVTQPTQLTFDGKGYDEVDYDRIMEFIKILKGRFGGKTGTCN